MGLHDRPQGRVVQRPDALTRIGRFVVVCVVGAGALWLLYKIRAVLLVVIVGMAIAYALSPLVKAFSGNRPHLRPLGITLAYLTVFGGLAASSVFGFRPVVDDARIFAATLPDSVNRLDAWLAHISAGLHQALPSRLQAQQEPNTGNMIAGKLQSFTSNLGQYVARIAVMGQTFVILAAAGALALVISVFILGDPTYFRRQLFAVIPVAFQADAETLLSQVDLVLAAFVRGQIVIAVAVGLTATLAMRLMGVKYAVILGLFTALTQLIPQVGGAIGLIVAVALASLQSPALALGVFVLYMVLYEISGHVLAPLVMGRAVKLHPLVILLATMVGTVLGGVVGLLLSVPAAAVLKVVWTFFYPRLAPRWGLELSRDHYASTMPPDHEASPATSETRNRIRIRVEQWRANLEQLRAERKEMIGEARREHTKRLQELQAKIAEEVREWHAGVDEYDADPTQTTQKAFEEQVGLREIERQINADLAAWKKEGHGVG